ncbi:MAG: adenylate/guanylate cyclase domain-containing protein, partial [Chloroflexota bacterium]|nr:adenylate/guanylate cyclase domain-containing protein [Chloroflexota bacterium]
GNLAYTVGFTPHGMNLTPVTFSVSGLLIAWGLFRYRILDITPVARDAIVESMSDGVIVLDPQNRVVDLNPMAQTLVGHTLSKVIGQPLAQVMADWPALMELCREQESAGGIHTEIALNIGEGEERIFDLRVSPLFDRRGRLTGRLMLWHDVTEHRQAEEKLRQLSRAVEQSGSTIVITNLDGDIEFVNPAFTRVTGYTPEETIGENTRILKSGEHPTEFYRELWDTIDRGEVWQGEMVNRKKNGEFYWEAATISAVKDEAGRTTHYLAIKEEITARKKIEAALAQEQLKSDALLRNILPAGIVAEIKEHGKVAPVSFDCASIMFTDFGNFTATAERLGPQELVDSLDRYFTAFDRVIEKHSLEKLKTIGDGYMCASGLPFPNSTHAVDIVGAALEILDFTRREKEERQRTGQPYWEIRIGISSGPVIAGIVGRQKYAYDVWGDTVVVASRMESSGEIGRVNISQATYNLVKDRFDCEYRGKVHAKHKGQIEMYFVNGRVEQAPK